MLHGLSSAAHLSCPAPSPTAGHDGALVPPAGAPDAGAPQPLLAWLLLPLLLVLLFLLLAAYCFR